MTLQKRGLWSAILSVLGMILFIMSYAISSNPTSLEKIVIRLLFLSGIVFMFVGTMFSILGIKAKEKGFLKYTGMLIWILLTLGITLTPVIMGILGFNEP